MEAYIMALGFLLASYSVIGNDVIQTLGTFLSSNSERKWYVLWGYTSLIMVVVLVYGWAAHGDVSFGRLEKVPVPEVFHCWYALPPLILLFITRFGIPVSTTFLILSVFSFHSGQHGIADIFSPDLLIGKMMKKSVYGYLTAFGLAVLIYFVISKSVEKYFMNTEIDRNSNKLWTFLQWISTGFLWANWLIQDLANIYVFLPRNMEPWILAASVLTLISIQAFIFANKGGEIQKIVTSKTNTLDIRSATIIDFIYAVLLFVFKELSSIPMSTTWVFVGLLAGRELMIALRLERPSEGSVFKLIFKDLGKIVLGMLISILLIILILWLN